MGRGQNTSLILAHTEEKRRSIYGNVYYTAEEGIWETKKTTG